MHRDTLLRARAIENQAYVVGVNRTGSDPSFIYNGDSVVYGPYGEEILACGNSEAIFICKLEKDVVNSAREQFQVLNDRKR